MESISSRVSPRALLIIAGGVLLFVIALIALFAQFSRTAEQQTSQSSTTQPGAEQPASDGTLEFKSDIPTRKGDAPPEPGVIAQVGEERIYGKDLNYELAYGPVNPDREMRQLFFDKVLVDSMILQEARKRGMVQLDDSVYNSVSKNNKKRVDLVAQIKQEVAADAAKIEGSVISVWFYNEIAPDMGYQRAKQYTLEKITAVHERVKNGQLTMEQAANEIRKDAELAKADPAYATNAYFEFSANEDEKITFSSEFDSVVRNLQPGGVSDVVTVQDQPADQDKPLDAVHMFAKVDNKIQSSDISSLDSWIKELKQSYEVIVY
jgi:hypothetical protein